VSARRYGSPALANQRLSKIEIVTREHRALRRSKEIEC
jgi:hypothetical protein